MSMAEELADTHAAESADIGAVADAGIIGQEAPFRETPDKPEKPLSIRDGIKAAQREVEARARDDKGKFAKKSEEAPVAAASQEIPPEKTGLSPTPSKSVGIPPGFSAETKAFLDTLPQDHPIKRDLEKRETEISNGFKGYSDKAKQYDAIDQAVAPFRSAYQQAGLKSDAEAINRLFQWEQAVRSNPVQSITQLARQYGVDLSQLVQGNSQVPQGQEAPEYIRPILDQYGQLSQSVQSLEARIQEADQQKVTETLSSFAKDKPHFEKVRVRMGQMMAAGIASPTDLDGAYQQAVWADAELREALLKEQDDKRQAEFIKTQAAAGRNARLAAVSPAPKGRVGAPVANGHDKGGTIRDSIMAAKKELEENQRA